MKLTAALTLAVFACGGAAAVAPPSVAPAPAKPIVTREHHAPEHECCSWISPGPLQLELRGAPIQAVHEGQAVEVEIKDDQGSVLHVVVHLANVRFAAWVERARLFAIVTRDMRVTARDGSDFQPPGAGEPIEAIVKAGARVHRLAHEHGWTRVRYYGALEIEGWLPDDALAERGPSHDPASFIARGQVETMLPGSVIRTETRWGARALATTANGYFVDKIADVDDAWFEASYEDSDVKVHGFVSKHDPPGRVHRPHEDENPPAITPNGKLVAGTCLYAHGGGEPIGSVVQDTPAEIAAGSAGDWFDVSIDTPWGPIAFAATGATESELLPCPTSP